ncbi:DUF2163 domain-containing protein [Erwinia sp. E602]|uniref:DUF2163 domain-containing protein n=1 Tax=Erwinia sp. E602 TaxID=2675378 RepID=UPI002012A305|nr:DUF2163 domain-containing protein [Erwinia sp. E602]
MKGTTKTVLTEMEVFSLGVHVLCFDVLPVGSSAYYWTDGLTDIRVKGNNYTSFPDVVKNSLPNFSESKSIENNSIAFKVSNVNDSVRAIALAGGLKNAQMNFRVAILNPYNSEVLYDELLFSGFIDYVQSSADPVAATNELTININTVYKKLDRQPPVICANSVYQSYFPGDECMSLLGQMVTGQQWKYN